MVWPNSHNTPIFSDEHGIGGQVGRITNKAHGGKQYEWFAPDVGKGLTNAGLGRLNHSIEVFLYCVVGAEVYKRSSIVGHQAGAQETRTTFLELFEDEIKIKDRSTKRYQDAIQEAKLN